MPPAPSAKDSAIETLRGLAVLLLVGFHCIEGDPNGARGSLGYEYAGYSFSYVRMPLFTVISGFIYAMRPCTASHVGTFLRGKARRLLLPMLCATTLTYVLKSVFEGKTQRFALAQAWRVYLFSYDHFWFLQALTLVFLLVALLDGRLRLLDTPRRWLSMAVLVTSAGLLIPGHEFFSFRGMLYLTPFFVLGIGLYRFPFLLRTPSVLGLAVMAAVVGLTLHQAAWWAHLPIPTGRHTVLSFLAGMGVATVLFRFRAAWPPLSAIGLHAFPIYLYHLLAISVATRVAAAGGIQNTHALFFCKLVCGIGLPVLTSLLLQRHPATRFFFLGLRWKLRPSSPHAT